jgi:hypothetical protein
VGKLMTLDLSGRSRSKSLKLDLSAGQVRLPLSSHFCLGGLGVLSSQNVELWLGQNHETPDGSACKRQCWWITARLGRVFLAPS